MTMIRGSELERELSSERFQLAYEDEGTMEFVLVRSRDDELFERIRLSHGNSGKIATVGAEISIVPGRTGLKGLCIHRCLVEVASDQTTGWTSLDDEQSIEEFKTRIRSFAPSACRKLSEEAGSQLVENTKVARMRAKQYIKILEGVSSRELHEGLSPNAQAEVDRILQQRIVCIPEGRPFYETALQVIATYCGEIERDENWLRGRDADSMSGRELMIRLHIIASWLAGEHGWSSSAHV